MEELNLAATTEWPTPAEAAASYPGYVDSSCDGAPEDHKWPEPTIESLQVAEHGTIDQQAQANALNTIQEILFTLNFLTSEANRPVDDTDVDDSATEDPDVSDDNTVVPANRTPPKPTPEDPVTTEDEDGNDFLQVRMPVKPNPTIKGTTTFMYESALRNRIKYPKLGRGQDYDTRAFTPTFIHDCLMLPGSLATVIGKQSPAQIIRRLTPALLPGFHAHVHSDNQQPCLLQSPDPKDYVQGLVLFGQARAARDLIHAHYRAHARRVKVQIEIDFLSPDPGQPSGWILFRKKLWAHAWLWANVGSLDVNQFGLEQSWTIEEYLAGTLGGPQGMRRGYEGNVGGDYEVGTSDGEEEVVVLAEHRAGVGRREVEGMPSQEVEGMGDYEREVKEGGVEREVALLW